MTNKYEYFKKYNEEHREQRNANAKAYYHKNKEKCNEYAKQKRLEIKNDPELNQKMKDYKREWFRNKRRKDKENAELVIKYKEVLDKIKEKDVMYYDPEYSKVYGELCSMPGVNNTRTPVIVIDDEILELLEEIE